MIRFLFFLFFIFTVCISPAQNLSGQWKGWFVDKSVPNSSWGGIRCDYVLDLEVKGKTVSGYSYTYFTDGGKKYYTICRLKGVAVLNKKYIEVIETVRTKTNVPDNISNSFQLHKLRWRKEGDKEILEGNWEPAPGQNTNGIGYGTTSLMKRKLSEIFPLAKKITVKKEVASPREKPATASTKPNASPKKYPPTAAKAPLKKIPPPAVRVPAKPIIKDPVTVIKKDTLPKPVIITTVIPPAEKTKPPIFEKRNTSVLQTIIIVNTTVRVELYDNGYIDGDSISLFYNNKLLLAHKRLTENPIILELPVGNETENELVMYANNLGTIPPNTALMIVRDGNKRYEVRITSDLKKSGTIRFVHKKQDSE